MEELNDNDEAALQIAETLSALEAQPQAQAAASETARRQPGTAPGDALALATRTDHAPAGGASSAPSWKGQIFVRLNQAAKTVTEADGSKKRMVATKTLGASSADTVSSVKRQLQGTCAVERLLFAGRELPDHTTLAESGVSCESTLDALPRCVGGAPTAEGSDSAELAAVRRELDRMRHLSQEMAARLVLLQGTGVGPAVASAGAEEVASSVQQFPEQHACGEGVVSKDNAKTFKPLETPANWKQICDPWKDIALVKLPEESAEYQEVDALFMKTCSQWQIAQIERVQNFPQWQYYVTRKRALESRNQPSGANEKRLFHGTSKEKLPLINRNSFNRGYVSWHGPWGQGVCFSRDASYATYDCYSMPDVQGNKYMYLARVLVGEYCKGNSGYRVPPLQPGSEWTFDSTVDDINNPGVFVSFHDAQSYPEYLITFKEDASLRDKRDNEREEREREEREREKREREVELRVKLELDRHSIDFSGCLVGRGCSTDIRRGTYHFPGQQSPQPVAYKIFRDAPQLSVSIRNTVLEELDQARRNPHPNVCILHGFLEIPDCGPAFVLEIGDRSLRAVLDDIAQFPYLPWSLRVKWLLDIVAGLQYLQVDTKCEGRAIGHGNLKAANVLLTADLALAKITDFGGMNVAARTIQSLSEDPPVPLTGGNTSEEAAAAMVPGNDMCSFGMTCFEVCSRKVLPVNIRLPDLNDVELGCPKSLVDWMPRLWADSGQGESKQLFSLASTQNVLASLYEGRCIDQVAKTLLTPESMVSV